MYKFKTFSWAKDIVEWLNENKPKQIISMVWNDWSKEYVIFYIE